MKMRLKKKNTSHKYNINRARPKQGQEFIKYKMSLIIMIVIYIKQHLEQHLKLNS